MPDHHSQRGNTTLQEKPRCRVCVHGLVGAGHILEDGQGGLAAIIPWLLKKTEELWKNTEEPKRTRAIGRTLEEQLEGLFGNSANEELQ